MKNKVSKIYENKENFLVIGLTGKTGSGCSTVSNILENGYMDYNVNDCDNKLIQNRKDFIIKKFANVNFKDKKFKIIKPSTFMMMLFVFEKQIILGKIKSFKELLDKKDAEIDFINKDNPDNFNKLLKDELKNLKELYKIIISFKEFNKIEIFKDFEDNFNEQINFTSEEKKKLSNYISEEKQKYENKVISQNKKELLEEINSLFQCELNSKKFKKIKRDTKYKVLNDSEYSKENIEEKIKIKRRIIDKVLNYLAKDKSEEFIKIYEVFNAKIIEKREKNILSIQQMQMIGDLVREQIDIFQLPSYTNLLIKAFRQISKKENKSCYVAIDSLKNPFEILYFKERYSAYYTFSIHAKDETIYERFLEKDLSNIKLIHKKELNENEKGKQGGSLDSSKDFNSQNVIECIQRSDIYIDNNKDKKDTLYKQIFRYLSLIIHPGLITPSKDEMIMQLALNAKFNSGCISRQVGAVVLNKFDSVKSIGWNEVPEGQMPCLLRSHSELLNNSPSLIYSKYEKEKVRNEDNFKYIFTKENPNNQYVESNKKGLNDSFCFKSIKNNIDGNKNQVYTRSLHAEENAFLQASKYGNSEIIGGQLFTTASPCFLCAKKAYQLGMKRIVYIEAYPDISNEQVFDIGTNEIEMVHFRGAIGLAYQKLYEPIFSYKDELNALNKK